MKTTTTDKHAHSSNPDTIAGLERLDRQFMTPDIWQADVWEVSANHGETQYVPTDVLSRPGLHVHDTGITVDALQDYVCGTIDTDDDGNPIAELRVGVYCARLSAPGYMDATDLSVFDTLADAEDYLADAFADDWPNADNDDTDSE